VTQAESASSKYRHDQGGWFKRFIRESAAWKPVSLFYAHTLHHIDRVVYKCSNGRQTFASWLAGLPIVMLTTTGAKSGKPRTVPVVGIPDGDDVVVIASSFARRHNPGWYHNLRANPRASIHWEGRDLQVEARELEGDERRRFYERGIAIYPGWVQYEKRAPRRIPVLRLEPEPGTQKGPP
jgi:deazaflavin-dependent oxidoreductase (nitroreductase family)